MVGTLVIPLEGIFAIGSNNKNVTNESQVKESCQWVGIVVHLLFKSGR